jgi:Na+-transporting NADH:ubiquinone oxidoreductase subunit B
MNKFVMRQRLMDKVLIALFPISLFSVFLFGWRVLVVLLVSNIFAFVAEYLFIRKKKNGKVSSAAFVTATLLALSLPPTIPFWIVAVGVIIAIVFGKMVFGGFGMNIFNPAIVGRAFIYVSFPNEMTINWLKPFTKFPGGFAAWQNSNLLTSATPMMNIEELQTSGLSKLFIGNIAGSIGETSTLLILLAGIYLVYTKTAKWQGIVAFILASVTFSALFYHGNPLPFLLSGGAMFGAIFMITDPVSSPRNITALWIYGALVGFLTVLIRKYALFTEGFMFAVLLANSFIPIIEFGLDKAKVRKK